MREDSTMLNSKETFSANSEIVSKLLCDSESGRSAEFYKNQLFPTLTAENEKERNKAKEKIFNEGYERNSKNHKPDGEIR